jgi:hypothetical protein
MGREVAERWIERKKEHGHPVLPSTRPPTTVLSLTSLTPGCVLAVLASAPGTGVSLPFGLSDVGWILAAAAVVLVLALIIQALVRRRATSPRPQPVGRRSTDP